MNNNIIDQILIINNNSVPDVNFLNFDELSLLINNSYYFDTIELNGFVAGFMLALDNKCDYSSENYKWFQSRYDDFIYIDRIALSKVTQGRGIGKQLYTKFISHCKRNKVILIVSEVNIEPVNEKSMVFHKRMGFIQIDTFNNKNSGKLVAMMALPISCDDKIAQQADARDRFAPGDL